MKISYRKGHRKSVKKNGHKQTIVVKRTRIKRKSN